MYAGYPRAESFAISQNGQQAGVAKHQVGNPAASVEVVAWGLLPQLAEKRPGLFGVGNPLSFCPSIYKLHATLLSSKEPLPYSLGAPCLFFERKHWTAGWFTKISRHSQDSRD